MSLRNENERRLAEANKKRADAIKLLRTADFSEVPSERLVAVARELEIYGARKQ